MLLGFLEHLRRYRVPVSTREFIDLLSLMRRSLVFADQEGFYFMSRLALVKDEKYYDRFDQAFASYFDGIDRWSGLFTEDNEDIHRELLKYVAESRESVDLLRDYSGEVRQQRETLISSLEGDVSQETGSKQERDESKSPREARKGDNTSETDEPGEAGEGDEGSEGEGGSGEGEEGNEGEGESGESGEGDEGKEGEGDAGDAGLGLSEYGEEGEREDETQKHRKRATKVWLDREFADYDPDVELGTRNLKVALRRLRRWAREAADLELDLHGTIQSTAANGGFLDIKEVPERHNAVKVLMLFDVGGSMDEHIELCAQLFSAARSEFKQLEYYYFHNFLYEGVWTENDRRFEDRIPTWQLLQKYGRDYKVIIVGDADMGRQEISDKGGSVEHYNAEPGEVWLHRILEQFRSVAWLNPVPESRWRDSFSIQMVKKRMDDHMFFLSDTGLQAAMKQLMK